MRETELLDGLTTALSASPENLQLRLSVIRLAVDAGKIDLLKETIAPLNGDALPESADRQLVANALLAADEPQRALDHLASELAAERILRARALLMLGREEEAHVEYTAAIRDNPALEDQTLAAQLSAFTIKAGNDDRPRLRVIANDDTDDDELVRMLAPNEEPVTFKNVRGLDQVKDEIRRKIILPYQKPSLFKRFRKRIGGGILLYGPPGCGKTLLARATAGECNAQFFNIMISDILDMYIGESERKLHALFETVRQNAPAVLFFDEIEAVGAKRQYSREGA